MRDKFYFNVLLVIMPLYFLQGWLFDHGSLVSQTIVAVWLLIDIIYLCKYINLGLCESVGRIFFIFWLFQTLTWLFSPFFSDNRLNSVGWGSTYSVYKNISVVFLSYYPFYYLSYKKVIENKQLKKLAFLSLLCLIAAYYISAEETALYRDSTEITNNGAYYLVVIVPLLGLYFDKKIEFVLYGGILLLVLLGAKRGAILCAAVEILLFFYFYSKYSNLSKKPFRILWSITAFLTIAYLGMDLFEGNDYLQQRYDQTLSGDSSLRDVLYSQALQYFKSQRLLTQIFGNGMSSTLLIIGDFAHQDWIELLINNGLLGVSIYVMTFLTLFFYYFRIRKRMPLMVRFMFLSAIFGWLMRSLYSMGYYSIETCFYVITFGFLSANQHKFVKS